MKPTRSDFRIVKVTNGKIFIEDLNLGHLSVTNDAEAVVDSVCDWAKSVGGETDPRIIYRDSDGKWDELAHTGGAFTGFLPYNEDLP